MCQELDQLELAWWQWHQSTVLVRLDELSFAAHVVLLGGLLWRAWTQAFRSRPEEHVAFLAANLLLACTCCVVLLVGRHRPSIAAWWTRWRRPIICAWRISVAVPLFASVAKNVSLDEGWWPVTLNALGASGILPGLWLQFAFQEKRWINLAVQGATVALMWRNAKPVCETGICTNDYNRQLVRHVTRLLSDMREAFYPRRDLPGLAAAPDDPLAVDVGMCVAVVQMLQLVLGLVAAHLLLQLVEDNSRALFVLQMLRRRVVHDFGAEALGYIALDLAALAMSTICAWAVLEQVYNVPALLEAAARWELHG